LSTIDGNLPSVPDDNLIRDTIARLGLIVRAPTI
jgi:hypothetical protein